MHKFPHPYQGQVGQLLPPGGVVGPSCVAKAEDLGLDGVQCKGRCALAEALAWGCSSSEGGGEGSNRLLVWLAFHCGLLLS